MSWLVSKGRMLMLLKEKNKVGIAHKTRKKYQALMPAKRIKKEERTKKKTVISKKKENMSRGLRRGRS